MPKRLILASNNAKKLRELQALIAPLGVDLVTQGSLGIPEAEEPHLTFVENALAKARHAAALANGPALADDSGLCVDALGGAPGVRSARHAVDAGRIAEGLPREQIDAANNAWLLTQMAGQAQRGAHFTCLLVAVRHANDPEPLIAEGQWRGELLPAAQGEQGFGQRRGLGRFGVLELAGALAQHVAAGQELQDIGVRGGFGLDEHRR